MFKRITLAVALAAMGLLPTTAAHAAGASGPAIYVNGDLFRTVGTKTDLTPRERA